MACHQPAGKTKISPGSCKLPDPGAGNVHLVHLDPVSPALLQGLLADPGKAPGLIPGIETRPVHRDNAGEVKETLPAVPGRQLSDRITPDNEKKLITLVALPENLQGIDHVAGAFTLKLGGTGLQEFGFPGNYSNHLQAVVRRRQPAVILLVRRRSRWEQQYAVELMAGVNRPADSEMPQVNGIEGASEYTDLHEKPGLLGQRDDSPGKNQG